MKQQTGSKVGKEYVKAVYCHPAYLTYIQSTSCKTPSWMKHSWNQDCQEKNINNLRYVDDTTLMAESEELKSLLMKVKEESEKVGLKLHIHGIRLTSCRIIWHDPAKIMASGPITSWQIDGETVETVSDFILGLQNHCRW